MSNEPIEDPDAEAATELEPDEPPRDDIWVETCDVLNVLVSDFEKESGRVEGETVDYNGSDEEPVL